MHKRELTRSKLQDEKTKDVLQSQPATEEKSVLRSALVEAVDRLLAECYKHDRQLEIETSCFFEE
jgi:hypothetical protein